MARSDRESPAAGRETLSFGKIVGLFGVNGDLRVHLHNRASQLLDEGGEVLLVAGDGTERWAWMQTRPGPGGRVIARLRGLEDREQARALIGTELRIAEDALPPTEEGEYYHRDLLGLAVYEGERLLGKLVEVHSGAVDVWTVEGEGEVHFIPATRERVLRVDLAAGRVLVRS